MAELRGTRKRIYVADLFARISRRYDLMNTIMTFGMDRRWRRTAAKVAMQNLEGPALDVATGTGGLAIELGRIKESTRVVGVDLLRPMVAIAASKADVMTRPSFVIGDALSLPFSDDTFNCVTSGFSLRNMPDPEASLREMVRVVKNGGRVLSLETLSPDGGFFQPLVQNYFRRVVPLLGSLIAGDKVAYTYLTQSVEGFFSSEELGELFQSVGLKGVAHRSLGLGLIHIHWGIKGN